MEHDATTLMDSSPIDTSSSEASTSAETETTETATEKTATTEASTETTTEKETQQPTEPEKEPPFHEHPRWKELQAERRQERRELEDLRRQVAESTKAPEKSTERNFDAERADLKRTLEKGELEVEEYDAKMSQVYRDQAEANIQAKLSEFDKAMSEKEQARQSKEFQDNYLKTNPEVAAILKDRIDDIEGAINDNPMHDPLSAAQDIYIRDLKAGYEKDKETAVKDAVAKKEQEMLANFKAKRDARAIGGGPPVGDVDDAAELKDTEKQGGPIQAIARRLDRARGAA